MQGRHLRGAGEPSPPQGKRRKEKKKEKKRRKEKKKEKKEKREKKEKKKERIIIIKNFYSPVSKTGVPKVLDAEGHFSDTVRACGPQGIPCERQSHEGFRA